MGRNEVVPRAYWLVFWKEDGLLLIMAGGKGGIPAPDYPVQEGRYGV